MTTDRLGATAVVRPAGVEDVGLLTRLREEWTAEQQDEPIDDPGFGAEFAAWFEREAEHRLTWLAEIESTPVGMLNMLVFTRMPKPARRTTSQWGYVANVYVDAAHRDAGVGRMLLDAATAHARAHDFVRLVLSPSERSIPFYERAGFVPAASLMINELS
ncbi:MAG TPA: GNAT family N-acetyltransferase [Nocardioidaceae bacterium]|nr:GNAT family N-acetyltransferase [Nocardioidaceae bacterium]